MFLGLSLAVPLCPATIPPMADHYTKLWASILDSSVWREPPGHRLVWIAMLLMKDRNGFVGASVDGLARRANVTEEETRAALESFLAPDPRSRNQEHEGRRIVVVPRGWHILNHEYFTQLQDKEAMRAYEAERKAEQRKRAKSHNVRDKSGQERDKGDSTRLSLHVQTTGTAPSTGSLPSESLPQGGREGESTRTREEPKPAEPDPVSAKPAAVAPPVNREGIRLLHFLAEKRIMDLAMTERVELANSAASAGVTPDMCRKFLASMKDRGKDPEQCKGLLVSKLRDPASLVNWNTSETYLSAKGT